MEMKMIMIMTMTTGVAKFLLLALTLLFIIRETSSETLVLTALVDNSKFALVEFTACTKISNFSAYSFFDYQYAAYSDPDSLYTGDNYANISKGTRIYVVTALHVTYGLNDSLFNDFFGFTPPHLYFSNNISFYGNDTFEVYRNGTLYDTYSTPLTNNEGTDTDFQLGWAVRRDGKLPSTTFNVADWTVTPYAYDSKPTTNALSPNPITLGNYTCPFIIDFPFGVCFSESNTVEVEGKGVIAIKHLQIGDKVKDANGNMVSVYSFGHYQPNAVAEYLQIHVQGLGKPLEVSKDHLVFVNGTTIPASTISVGDEIDVSSSSSSSSSSRNTADTTCVATTTTSRVKKIRTVTRKGVYAPFTTSGSIVVSGVVASSYVTLQPNSPVVELIANGNNNYNYNTFLSMHWLCHVFQTPHRWMCSYVVGMSTCRKWETYNDDGMAQWMVRPHHVMSSWLNGHDRGIVMTAMIFPTFVFPFVLGLMLYAMEVAGWMMIMSLIVIALVTATTTISGIQRAMKHGTTRTTTKPMCC